MSVAINASYSSSLVQNLQCLTQCVERKGSITWRIERLTNPSLYQSEKKVLSSQVFPVPVSGREFRLQLNTGTAAGTSFEEGCVGLFLWHVKGLECVVSVQFCLIDISGKKTRQLQFSHTLNAGQVWGFKNFVTRKPLLEEKLIHYNEVTVICCTVTMWEEPTTTGLARDPLSAAETTGKGSLLEEWKIFYEQKLNTDVVLKVGNEQFKAHKAVLMCRSPVFKAMLQNDMREKISGEVAIDEVDSDVFEQLLMYMYTNEFTCTPRPVSFIARMMVAADRYDMQTLKSDCSYDLCRYVSPDNVLEVLKITQLCSNEELDKACLSVVNRELSPATCVLDCMKRVNGLAPQVLDLLKKRFVDDDCPEQNKRQCSEGCLAGDAGPELNSADRI